MKNLMFDLETLGRKPGCAIIEIGWCCFSHEEYKVSAAFGVVIPVEQNMLYSFRKETDTLKWWLETQKGLPPLVPERAHITMPQILSDVASQWNELWFAGVQRLWSKPSLFDIPILKEAFDLVGIERPIILREENFWCWRDMVTLLEIEQPAARAEAKAAVTAHRAKEDALAQAHRVSKILSLQHITMRKVQDYEMSLDDNKYIREQNQRQADKIRILESSLVRARGRKLSKSKSRKR